MPWRKLGFSLLVFVTAGEVMVRLVGTTDIHGNLSVGTFAVKPYRIDTELLRDRLSQPPWAEYGYHARLGWAPVAFGESRDGLYRFNSSGMRSAPTEYTNRPADGTMRIALFGDSFTMGNEVPFESTWGYLLDQDLDSLQVTSEVLNFAVSSYGIDQAYLRWKEEGSSFMPHVVLLGFVSEDVKRNLYLYRGFYQRREIHPYTKPRFYLESDELKLINVPPIPPQELPDVLDDFDSWEWAKHDYFYDPSDYQDRVWRKSKFLSLGLEVADRLRKKLRSIPYETEFFSPDGEPGRLAIAIIEKFAGEVRSAGAEFFIVELPFIHDLKRMREGKSARHAEFLRVLQRRFRVIDPTAPLLRELEASSLSSIYRPHGHFTETGNRIVAATVAGYLTQQELQVSSGIED